MRRIAPLLVAVSWMGCSEAQPAPENPQTSTGPTTAVTSTPSATSTATASTAETPTSQAPAKLGAYSLKFDQTGGIAGFQMHLTVDLAKGKATYGGMRNDKPETRDVTAEEMRDVTTALEAAPYTSFAGPIKGPVIPDAFTYAITLTTADREYKVSWSDGMQGQEKLGAVRAAIAKLRDAKFPPGGGGGATK